MPVAGRRVSRGVYVTEGSGRTCPMGRGVTEVTHTKVLSCGVLGAIYWLIC